MHYTCYTKLLALYFIGSTVQGINHFYGMMLRYIKEWLMLKSTSGHPSGNKLILTQLKTNHVGVPITHIMPYLYDFEDKNH